MQRLILSRANLARTRNLWAQRRAIRAKQGIFQLIWVLINAACALLERIVDLAHHSSAVVTSIHTNPMVVSPFARLASAKLFPQLDRLSAPLKSLLLP